MSIRDIDLIEEEACPVCLARPREYCRGQWDQGRIWPLAPGSSAPHWCHPARRQLAIDHGRIKDLTP